MKTPAREPQTGLDAFFNGLLRNIAAEEKAVLKHAALVLLIGFLGISAAFADQHTPQPKRLAVVDVGETKRLPQAFVDLLYLAFAKQKSIVLLERADIDRLLREQAIGLLSAGNIPPDEAVKAGHLFAVDAFLLLEASDHDDNQHGRRAQVSARLVDARYGIRLHDFQFLLPSPEKYEAFAATIARATGSQLVQIKENADAMCLIGVLGFKNLEPSAKWDYLADAIQAGAEQTLMSMPQVIVAERRHTAPIREERELVTGLPAALRASVVVVDGEYAFLRDKTNVLSVLARGRRNDKELFAVRCEGSLDDPFRLGKDIAEAVGGKLGAIEPITVPDPEIEAELLMAQAGTALDCATAIGAAEAAMAVMPDADTCKIAYLETLHKWRGAAVCKDMSQCPSHVGWNGWLRGADGEPNEISLYRARRYITVLGQLIGKWARDPAFSPPENLYNLYQFVGTMLDFIRPADRERPEIRDLVEGQVLPILAQAWPLAKKHPAHARLLAVYVELYSKFGPRTMDEALAFYTDFVELADTTALLTLSNAEFLNYPAALERKDRWDQYRQFYVALQKRSEARLRLVGEHGLVCIYAREPKDGHYDLARNQYERYESFFLRDILPQHPEFVADPFWIAPLLTSADYRYGEKAADDLQFKADHLAYVLKYVSTNLPTAVSWTWTWYGQNVKLLEDAGRSRDAEAILNVYLAGMKQYLAANLGDYHSHVLRGAIRDHEAALKYLRARHTELTTPDPAMLTSNLEAQVLFLTKDIPRYPGAAAAKIQDSATINARSLIMENGAAIIVCDRGILRLNPDSLEPVDFVGCPGGVILNGPCVLDGDGMYAVCSKGILAFPHQKEPQVLPDDNSRLSGGINGMDVLQGKLYVLVGGGAVLGSEALIVYDLTSGQNRILLSAKVGVTAKPFHGFSGLSSIVADREHARLLLWMHGDGGSNEATGAYAFYPKRDVFERCDVGLSPFAYRRGNELIEKRFLGVTFWDLARESAIWSLQNRSLRFESCSAICRIGQGMTCVKGGDLYWFHDGRSEPDIINTRVFSSYDTENPSIRDMAMHKKGLLILTDRSLCLVPGIRQAAGEQTRGAKEAATAEGASTCNASDTPRVNVALWKSSEKLFSAAGRAVIKDVELAGDTAYVLTGEGSPATVVLQCLNLQNGERHRLGTVDTTTNEFVFFDKYPRVTWKQVNVGQQSVYVPTSSRLLIFPLDGGRVRQLIAGRDLPEAEITSVVEVGGKLYLGCCVLETIRNGTGWEIRFREGLLVQYDLDRGDYTILASSARRQKASALDNCPPYSIPGFFLDKPKERLGMVVAGQWPQGFANMGLWSLDLTNGAISKIRDWYTTWPEAPRRTEDGRCLLGGRSGRDQYLWNTDSNEFVNFAHDSFRTPVGSFQSGKSMAILNDGLYAMVDRAFSPYEFKYLPRHKSAEECPVLPNLENEAPFFLDTWHGTLIACTRHAVWKLRPVEDAEKPSVTPVAAEQSPGP